MDGPADPLTMTALESLRWNWGDAYEIGMTDSGWRARRADGLGGWITAAGADDLRDEILNDYTVRPVPRSPAER